MAIKVKHAVLRLKGQDMIANSVVDNHIRCVLQRDDERYFEYEVDTGVLYAIDHVTETEVKAHVATEDDFFVDPELQPEKRMEKTKVYTAYGEEEVSTPEPKTALDTYGLMELLRRRRWLNPPDALDLSSEKRASQVLKACTTPNVDVKHLVQELNRLDLDINWDKVFLTRYHTEGWEMSVELETCLRDADYSPSETSI